MMAQYELKLINDINIIHVNTDWINMKSRNDKKGNGLDLR